MASKTVALVTYAAFPDLAPDDRLLRDVLLRRGIGAQAVVWDNRDARWGGFDAIVIRSTWDYHLRHAEFLGWIDRIASSGAQVWNPPAVLRWNADKTYLRDLASRGAPVVPTQWVEPGAKVSLTELLTYQGWDRAVMKPAISASAHETWRVTLGRDRADEAKFRSLVARGRVLVQPYVREVETEGEWSLIFLGGRFSHAVVKQPAPGDFRVQVELGGRARAATADPAIVRVAAGILALAPEPCLYARVDGCIVGGAFRLMELELLEPTLFLDQPPAAAERLGEEIAKRLSSGNLES